MKELSIKEKAKRYDEALARANEMIKDMTNIGGVAKVDDIQYIFPELAESEDERIIKRIVHALHGDVLEMSEIKEAIDWLEKQREQKPTNRAKSKFKADDWVVCNNGPHHIFQVIERSWPNAKYRNINGIEILLNVNTLDKQYHLWTIQDAKDGDVLIDKSHDRECPFIFKETKPSSIKTDVLNPLTVLGYCGIGGAGFTKGSGWGDTANCIYYPATKEQRDTLMKAMTDAGYEWDAEKKELKKIEQKSSWSQEDERMYRGLHNLIYSTPYCDSRNELSDWLKSLKDRYTWKPSDEQMEGIECTIKILKCQLNAGDNRLNSLYEDLKKLREE